MRADRKFYWAVMLISLFLTGCNQDGGTPAEESSSQATEQGTPRASDTSGQTQEELDTAAEDTGILGKLSKNYIEIMGSGSYLMKFRSATTIENEVMESETTMAVSGDKTSIHSTTAETDTVIVLMDGNTYMIDHLTKTVMVIPDTDTEEEPAMPEMPEAGEPVDVADIVYVGSGKEDGLVYEEYRTGSGTQVFYYFDGSDLKKIKTIDEGFESVMEILELSETVPDDVFVIPADYQQLSY